MFRSKHPIIPKRGVHLDLKGVPPTAPRLVELLKAFAAARYNVVLVEWEDTFPWTVDDRFRSPTAYTPEDIRRFLNVAGELGIEVIPLVQCMGHMETVLSVPGYECLREVADDASSINPLAAGARELIEKLVDDVLALMPEARYFHLGGDEVWRMGSSPDTQAYIEQHGKGALYLQHVEPILDRLHDRGIRPILWHDMMIHWDSAALNALAAKSDLMTWGYSGHPDTTQAHFNTKYVKRFHEHGFALWGATAYKGADGHDADLPDIPRRIENAQAWTEIARRFEYVGIVATAWSRYARDRVQCEPIDAALDALMGVGVVLHDGQPPKGGVAACVETLEALGEKARFEACKAAMERLAALRKWGWKAVEGIRAQMTLSRLDPRRRGAWVERQSIDQLRHIIEESEMIAQEVRQCFAGLIEQVWIEEYLATRLAPLREELSCLDVEPVE